VIPAVTVTSNLELPTSNRKDNLGRKREFSMRGLPLGNDRFASINGAYHADAIRYSHKSCRILDFNHAYQSKGEHLNS